MHDVLDKLAEVLYAYQRAPDAHTLDSRLGDALKAVLDRKVRPVLAKRLRQGDIDDVLSEITIAFWRYRHSIRAEETGRFIHAVAHRKLADQLRIYYREADHQLKETETESGSILDLVSKETDIGELTDQGVWETLLSAGLTDVEILVAYLLYLGQPKGMIANALGISPNTVTNALKRCREKLADPAKTVSGGKS